MGTNGQFGSIRKLPSGRYQVRYFHLGRRITADHTFPTKADARGISRRRRDRPQARQLRRPVGGSNHVRRVRRLVDRTAAAPTAHSQTRTTRNSSICCVRSGRRS